VRLRDQQVAAVAQDYAGRALVEAFALREVKVERRADPKFWGLRDPEGSVGLLELDAHGRIAAHRHPSGRQVSMQYSESHQLTRIQLPSGVRTILKYDSQERLSGLDRDGLEWQVHYTDTGHVAAIGYPDHTRELFEHSASGQLVGYVDRRSYKTRFVWENERLKQLIDANGHATTFQHGAWERADSLKRPDGTLEEFVREGAGFPSEVRLDGVTVAETQFAGTQLTAIRYADGETLSFAYDDAGRLQEGSTGDLKVTRAYDANGRLIREQIGDHVVSPAYAFDGQLESIVTDKGQVRFQYDGDRRLLRVEDWSGTQQHYRYGNADREINRIVPGLRETSTLTPVGLVAQVMIYDLRCTGRRATSLAASLA
jgi:YD repeat-containing protein